MATGETVKKVVKANKSAPANETSAISTDPSKCPICSKVFNSDKSMRTHHTLKHVKQNPAIKRLIAPVTVHRAAPARSVSELRSKCPICSKLFNSHRSMKIHHTHKHGNRKSAIERPTAPVTVPKAALVVPPIRSVSELRSKPPNIRIVSNVCPVCKKKFHNTANARHHYDSVHLKIGKAKCPKCLGQYSNLPNLRKHIASMHPNFPMPAELRLTPVQSHRNSVSEMTPVICPKPI